MNLAILGAGVVLASLAARPRSSAHLRRFAIAATWLTKAIALLKLPRSKVRSSA